MRNSYGRAAALPSAGFAAGPCLLKDTMQLASFYNNNFLLGHVAMMINEGLPNFIVENLRQKYNLASLRIGILGMAFKADIDDTRDSLSYKLGKILKFHSADVLYSDEYVKNDTFATKEEIISSCDVIIVAVPHSAYKKLKIPKDKKLVDLWGVIKTK
jgi:UDP-N-acetyl-D-mannosaminuronic acid dehydrogenase